MTRTATTRTYMNPTVKTTLRTRYYERQFLGEKKLTIQSMQTPRGRSADCNKRNRDFGDVSADGG